MKNEIEFTDEDGLILRQHLIKYKEAHKKDLTKIEADAIFHIVCQMGVREGIYKIKCNCENIKKTAFNNILSKRVSTNKNISTDFSQNKKLTKKTNSNPNPKHNPNPKNAKKRQGKIQRWVK